MYIDYSSWEVFKYSLNTLKLDPNNPRIKYRGEGNLNQTQIIQFLIENDSVYDLAKKISEEGYFIGEEPIICIEDDKKIVLEGNRRTAALKILQNPKKYLTTSKANVLAKNIAKNNFPVNQKLKCYIAPNRYLANPIIYERHNGVTLKRWKTGNQYAFVAEMYFNDGLSIEDICSVLNEKRAGIIKQLKAYNLFFEGKSILKEKDDISINVDSFDLTNLERFYGYSQGREFLGLEFNPENGELLISLPRLEFEKRLRIVFLKIINSTRFSREFNTESDKSKVVKELWLSDEITPEITIGKDKIKGKTSDLKADTDAKSRKNTTRRKKNKKNEYDTRIIPLDCEIIFDQTKLDTLFHELKSIPIDKTNTFAVLLRTYLEQSIYYYLLSNDKFDELSKKTNAINLKNNQAKIKTLANYLKGKHKIDEDLDIAAIMDILRFNNKKDFSSATLKIMLDFIKKNELDDHLDSATLKNLKHYIDRIKDGLDLAVHNINTIVDKEHNKRAWLHLEPLFSILSQNIKREE